MYNFLDSCKPWPATKTAIFLSNKNNNAVEFEFIEINEVLLLRNRKTTKLYAVFFKTVDLCTYAAQARQQ